MLGDHGRVGLVRTFKDNSNVNRQRGVIKNESTLMRNINKKQRKKSHGEGMLKVWCGQGLNANWEMKLDM